MKKSQTMMDFSDELKNYMSGKGKRLFKGNTKVDKQVKEILTNAQLLSEFDAALAKEAEFLMSGDINKQTFLERYKDLEKIFEAKLARITRGDNA